LNPSQKAIWDLEHRLENAQTGEGAYGTADYLAACLGLAEGTVMNERAILHRAGLLESRHPHGRRQLAHWYAILPAAFTPADGKHETILACAAQLDAYLATLPDFAARPNLAAKPRPHSGPHRTVDLGPQPTVSTSTGEGMGGRERSPIPSSSQDEGTGQRAASNGGAAAEGTNDNALPEGCDPPTPEFSAQLRELERGLDLRTIRRLADEARTRGDRVAVEKYQRLIVRCTAAA
jgi:hypothetical protein